MNSQKAKRRRESEEKIRNRIGLSQRRASDYVDLIRNALRYKNYGKGTAIQAGWENIRHAETMLLSRTLVDVQT